jgi:signal transduction histidine kinase/ActR/RegA family two-component response regulator
MSALTRPPAVFSLIERQQSAFEQIAAAVPLEQAIEDLLLWLEAQEGTGAITSVFWLSEDGARFEAGTAPNLPDAIRDAVLSARIGDGTCSCAAAAARREAVLADDIEHHPSWQAHRALAIAHGLHACWSVPISGADQAALGSFAMYHRMSRKAGRRDVELLASLGRTIGLMRERARSNAELARCRGELTLVREQLQNLQHLSMAGQLAAGFAHDFNNCLTIVTGNIEIALNALRKAGDARAIPALHKAMHGADQAAALARRLVAFSLPQALQRRTVDVSDLLEGIADLIAYLAGDLIEVRIAAPPGLWPIHVDPRELESAILNLAINARDAMPNGGQLIVRAGNDPTERIDSAAPCVVISVTDTGAGMAPEVRDHALDPFFTTKGEGRGSGLGLSQVHDFARRSGGQVRISSRPGRGTSVSISLPRALNEPYAQRPAMQDIFQHQGGDEGILVVEDNDAIRAQIVEALRDLGYIVLDAADSRSALKLLEANPGVELVLSDLSIRGIDGEMFVDIARRRWPHLKVLLTTGHSEVRQDGAAHQLLRKPFNLAALASNVRQVLDRERPASRREAPETSNSIKSYDQD